MWEVELQWLHKLYLNILTQIYQQNKRYQTVFHLSRGWEVEQQSMKILMNYHKEKSTLCRGLEKVRQARFRKISDSEHMITDINYKGLRKCRKEMKEHLTWIKMHKWMKKIEISVAKRIIRLSMTINKKLVQY